MAIGIEITRDLLKMCVELNVHLPAALALEQALNEKLIKNKAEEWREENKVAIQSYNDFIDKYAVLVKSTGSFDGANSMFM